VVPLDLTSDDVQDILHLLDGLPFGELSLETARFRLSLRRGGDGEWTQALEVLGVPSMLPAGAGTAGGTEPAAAQAAPPQAAPPQAAGAPDRAPVTGHGARGCPAGSSPAGQPERLIEVRAPLLGTFYRAPRPGAPPFVTVGSLVEPDTVVCIIETMKLMNSVTAGVSGTVAEILVGNAQFAEQGTVLMRLLESA
jgi:acetyl-CoA carboxylase biotin carboxyl carrier protein